MEYQETMETDQAATAVMHDLRQFLHCARDQRDAIDRAADAVAAAVGLMQGNEAALQKTYRALQRQIDQGVKVRVDGALDAHARTVTSATQKLNSLFGGALMRWQQLKFEVATLVFISSLLGGAAGVIVTVNLLGRI
jgi:hypothetical protein